MEIGDFFDKDGNITEYCWTFVQNLSYLVASRYYKFKDKEDLVSASLVDVVSFIKANRNNHTIRNVRSYIFTRIRNVMSNYLYKRIREDYVGDEKLINIESDTPECEVVDYEFDTVEEAREVAMKLWSIYEGARSSINT